MNEENIDISLINNEINTNILGDKSNIYVYLKIRDSIYSFFYKNYRVRGICKINFWNIHALFLFYKKADKTIFFYLDIKIKEEQIECLYNDILFLILPIKDYIANPTESNKFIHNSFLKNVYKSKLYKKLLIKFFMD
jgi:hypothetical protein